MASSWYYLDVTQQQQGPVSGDQLCAQHLMGEVQLNQLVWSEGMAAWQPLSSVAAQLGLPPDLPKVEKVVRTPWLVQGFADRVTDLVGLERIEGFSLREMLSAVFKRYGDDAIETYFSVGLKETTPPLSMVSTKWPKPWMFARALGFSLLLYFGFLTAMVVFNAPIALPAVIMTGSFAIPIATLLFFFEMNAPRNVSIYQVLKLLLLGGLLSIASSLLLFELTIVDDWIGPPAAGIIEELGKLLAVIMLTRSRDPSRYPYVLNGLLFGAAVGTGFAAFESAGYALLIMMENQSATDGNINIFIRGILSPFGHIVWTALTAGALWAAMRGGRFHAKMLFDRRVMTVLLTVMALHFVWNLPFAGPFLLKYWLIGFIGWVMVFGFVQTGLRQLRAARNVQETVVSGFSIDEIRRAIAEQNAQK